MTKFTISVDYGKYDNFTYTKDASIVELTWDAPDGLEAKYVKIFDAAVTSDLEKLEKDLNSGTSEAKKWLATQDKKMGDIVKQWEKEGCVSKKDAEYFEEIRDALPNIISNLEGQRFNVFNSKLDKALDNAAKELASKHKKEVFVAKCKKVAKIVGFAALALAGTALAIAATVLSFGVAAGPIIAAVGLAIGGVSTGASLIVKAKGIWGSGKEESKNLESAAKAYAEASEKFEEVLKRQTSYLVAKSAQLDVIEKQIKDAKKHLATLDSLKKSMGDKLQTKVEKAVKALLELESTQSELEAELKQQEKMVADANNKKTYEAAISLAQTLKADRGVLDKIGEHFGTVSNLLGGISGAMG